MINYKVPDKDKRRESPVRQVNLQIEEGPQWPEYTNLRQYQKRRKFILDTERIIRHSKEYKDYIRMLKKNLNWNRCAALRGIATGNGKKYSIEIHHEPFTLFDITHTVLTRFEDLDKEIDPYEIAYEVLKLHYDGKVGLIPLTVTQHELTGNGKIFIPLQFVYGDWATFYDEYENHIPDKTKAHVEIKAQMSEVCAEIQSNVLGTEFTYVHVDGWDIPNIPDEWGEKLRVTDFENFDEEKEAAKAEKEAKKAAKEAEKLAKEEKDLKENPEVTED